MELLSPGMIIRSGAAPFSFVQVFSEGFRINPYKLCRIQWYYMSVQTFQGAVYEI